MNERYLPLRAALDQLDEIINHSINLNWPTNFPEIFSPPHEILLEPREPGRFMFWAASVEAMWGFWKSSKRAWVCLPGESPSLILWSGGRADPVDATDLQNNQISLLKGQVVGDGLFSGSKTNPRTCEVGEPIAVSAQEFERFCSSITGWMEEVVCTPDADGYRKDRSDPGYVGYLDYWAARQPKKPTSIKQKQEGWLEYIASFTPPDKPIRAERRAKYKELGLSKAEGDLLHKNLSPKYWSSREGPKKSKQ